MMVRNGDSMNTKDITNTIKNSYTYMLIIKLFYSLDVILLSWAGLSILDSFIHNLNEMQFTSWNLILIIFNIITKI